MSDTFTAEQEEVTQSLKTAASALVGQNFYTDMAKLGLLNLSRNVAACNSSEIRRRLGFIPVSALRTSIENQEKIAEVLTQAANFYEKYSCQQRHFDFV